ncbi:hypothetical protein GCM10011514_52020 [Emticicia aquatilis]|uniref:DUF4062 domain-containing protein n=1 Tax=Emticicia aquatilis TaxID=1537369 RepID=A0A916Z8H5_9BACT|nr:DUF4062 domain-containing protein [Emticicia aquatilis]GGD81535.1 hypothetical protein GCM10011514_52020 [Emticicia aquatilis]
MANRNRKLQVFVSSTFIDLQEERQAAVQSILNAGHIPAGMELFTAGDESQWTIIKRWIEDSDVYMLLLGGRYGSIEPKSGKSYTHLEYEYAVNLKKPLFAIVMQEQALDEKVKEKGKFILELDNPQGLKEFRRVVTGNICSFWSDLKDIKLSINDSIRDIEYRYEGSLKGWIKDEGINFSSTLDELTRLSKENSELKLELANYQNSGEKINGVEIEKFAELLKNKKLNLSLSLGFDAETLLITNVLSLFYHYMNQRDVYFTIYNAIGYEIERNELEKYNLIINGKPSEIGTKLFVYLEMNKHLLEI